MLIDFQEIPYLNNKTQLSDSFELFARDFLQTLGFSIVSHPNRGPDGKKDLIVKEVRKGIPNITQDTEVVWLVSCKHYSTSNKSVSDNDEPDIIDRLVSNECSGFIGFYSTLVSSGLNNKLEKLNKIPNFEIQIFDREKIEYDSP